MPAKKKVTSSSDRSKRKANKPVSSDKGRKARAKVSTAKPTSSESRNTSGSGSRQVTGNKKGQQRAVDRRQAANRKTQSARAQRMNAGAKPAPQAAKPSPQAGSRGSGSSPSTRPKLTNLNKPTMQKLVRKAAQARKAAAGRPLVKPAEVQRLLSQRAPKIREGAAKLRVPGDSGQVRAAQATGRKLKAEAQARRGAKQASQRMQNTLKWAKTARDIVGGLKSLTKGGAAVAGLQAYNTGDGTLDAAKKRGDLNKRRKPTAQEAKSYAAAEAKARAANAKRKASSAASSAAAFDDAFRSARKAGAKTFTWRGKKYTTDLKK